MPTLMDAPKMYMPAQNNTFVLVNEILQNKDAMVLMLLLDCWWEFIFSREMNSRILWEIIEKPHAACALLFFFFSLCKRHDRGNTYPSA